MITLMYAILGCTQAPAPTTQVTFITGDVAACLTDKTPQTCYQAALDNPDHPETLSLLSHACIGRIGDSCRRYYEFVSDKDLPIHQESAMNMGCDGGDDYLCERYLEDAAKSDHPDQLEWVTNFVAEQRAKRR